MNTGRTDKEEKSGLPAGIGWVRFQKCMMRANKDYDIAASIARKEYGDGFLERQIKAMSVTAPTDGGYLVPEVYASEIIPARATRPSSCAWARRSCPWIAATSTSRK